MTDANLMDADCIHGVVWWSCTECCQPEEVCPVCRSVEPTFVTHGMTTFVCKNQWHEEHGTASMGPQNRIEYREGEWVNTDD